MKYWWVKEQEECGICSVSFECVCVCVYVFVCMYVCMCLGVLGVCMCFGCMFLSLNKCINVFIYYLNEYLCVLTAFVGVFECV